MVAPPVSFPRSVDDLTRATCAGRRLLSGWHLLLGFGLALAVGSVAAEDLTGQVSKVLDSDKFQVGNKRVLLWGIDGPESDQDRNCTLQGRRYGCWTNARRQLEVLVDQGPVLCKDSGAADPFLRPYMVCTVNSTDIGEAMVRSGWALAARTQSTQYVEAEAAAKAAKVGLWQDGLRFTLPWVWRSANGRE